MKNRIKCVAMIATEVVEVIIPCSCFVVLFIAFIWGIFARFVGTPVNWAYPVSCMMFTFFGLLAVSYSDRAPGSHVVFDIIYERMPEKAKPWMDLIGDLLILIPFVMVFLPTIKSFSQVTLKDSILLISYKYIYVSYVILIIETIIRYTYRVINRIVSTYRASREVKE